MHNLNLRCLVHRTLIYCHDPERSGQIVGSAGRLLAFCLTPNGSLFKQEHLARVPASSATGGECALHQKHGTQDLRKHSRCLEIQQTINPQPTWPALHTRPPGDRFNLEHKGRTVDEENEWTLQCQSFCSGFSRHSLIPGSRSRLMDNAETMFNPSDQSGDEFWHFLCNQTPLDLPWVIVVGSNTWDGGRETRVLTRFWDLLFSPTAGHWRPAEWRGEGDSADQRENQAADASRRCKFKQCFYSLYTHFQIFLLNLEIDRLHVLLLQYTFSIKSDSYLNIYYVWQGGPDRLECSRTSWQLQ